MSEEFEKEIELMRSKMQEQYNQDIAEHTWEISQKYKMRYSASKEYDDFMTSSEAEFEESAVVQKLETYDVEVREKHSKKTSPKELNES